MELKHLRTFQAVVDQGSYQRAADVLGYTQSTIISGPRQTLCAWRKRRWISSDMDLFLRLLRENLPRIRAASAAPAPACAAGRAYR